MGYRSATSGFRTLAATAFAFSGGAYANGPAAYFDVFYVPRAEIEYTLEQDGESYAFDEADTGFGVRGAVTLFPRIFVNGEFASNDYSYEGVDLELELIRGGLGVILSDSALLTYALVEFIDADAKIKTNVGGTSLRTTMSDDGYGAHLGVRGEKGPLGVVLQLGYLDLGDGDGLEWSVEFDHRISSRWGAFVGYRATYIEYDYGGGVEEDFDVSDLRIGATFYLNQ